MKVCEIFASIQGESTYSGLPCVFVRLSGCNLRCPYCDTAYSYKEGSEMAIDEIIGKVSNFGIMLVEITGGEPLLQDDSVSLVKMLLDNGFKVLIETNGSISIKDIDKRAVIIMDIKTPKSGMFGKMDMENLKYLKTDDEVKFVVMDREDYDWVKNFIRVHGLTDNCRVLLSPVYGILSPDNLSRWMVDDRLKARLNLQIHKYIYSPEARGV